MWRTVPRIKTAPPEAVEQWPAAASLARKTRCKICSSQHNKHHHFGLATGYYIWATWIQKCTRFKMRVSFCWEAQKHCSIQPFATGSHKPPKAYSSAAATRFVSVTDLGSTEMEIHSQRILTRCRHSGAIPISNRLSISRQTKGVSARQNETISTHQNSICGRAKRCLHSMKARAPTAVRCNLCFDNAIR